jgi:hypothetical protein
MVARSLSSKMASSIVKSASKSTTSLGSGDESSVIDMILMGAGVVIIILLLVYIYNRFIHKQPTKNEYYANPKPDASVEDNKCPKCPPPMVCPECPVCNPQ